MRLQRTIQDDRGVEHMAARPDQIIEVVRAEDGDAAAKELLRRTEGGQWVMRGFFWLIVLYLTTSLLLGLIGPISLRRVFLGVLLLIGAVLLDRRSGRWIRRSPDEMRPLLLGMGRCPACGYSLRAMKPESEGLICCPECSAAWAPPATPKGAAPASGR